MTNSEVLKEIKSALGNPVEKDNELQIYMREVIGFMLDGGVDESLLTDDAISKDCVGAIVKGVTDLWTYGSGESNLSPYFMMRVKQLAMRKVT